MDFWDELEYAPIQTKIDWWDVVITFGGVAALFVTSYLYYADS
jgi:hypothetical protein